MKCRSEKRTLDELGLVTSPPFTSSSSLLVTMTLLLPTIYTLTRSSFIYPCSQPFDSLPYDFDVLETRSISAAHPHLVPPPSRHFFAAFAQLGQRSRPDSSEIPLPQEVSRQPPVHGRTSCHVELRFGRRWDRLVGSSVQTSSRTDPWRRGRKDEIETATGSAVLEVHV